MNRNFSLALHDVKVSDDEKTVSIIKQVMNTFHVPLTVHLVFDKPLKKGTKLSDFIQKNIKNKKLEIVFHGLSHTCSKNVSKFGVFYHKYQAEYLDDNESLRKNTAVMYKSLISVLGSNLGICPPCWIATKKNRALFASLNPLYVESILSIEYPTQKIFSPVISLGSPKNSELFFLKIIAKISYLYSIINRKTHLRVAVHVCDVSNPASMHFFENIINLLRKNKFHPVFLKDLNSK